MLSFRREIEPSDSLNAVISGYLRSTEISVHSNAEQKVPATTLHQFRFIRIYIGIHIQRVKASKTIYKRKPLNVARTTSAVCTKESFKDLYVDLKQFHLKSE